MIELILGGTRSGKSHYAQQRAQSTEKAVIYIATARAESHDNEMLARIKRHQSDRPVHWKTVEEPVRLADTIRQYSTSENCILIDCLTLWLSNILFDHQGTLQTHQFQQEKEKLLQVLTQTNAHIILVSNEIGQGVIAIQQSTRQFVDEAGWLHQAIARISARVILVTAGLPLELKNDS